jgi:hypothetical protein
VTGAISTAFTITPATATKVLAIAYWSGVPGFPGGMANYKRKCDIGPTQDHYVFSLPVSDNKIDLEDLVILSFSYGLSILHQLPKLPALSEDNVEVTLGKPVVVGDETRIPVSGHVTLDVYNILGERVASLVNDVQDAGFYHVLWDGRDQNHNPVATGVYLYRARAGEFSSVKKMLLLK